MRDECAAMDPPHRVEAILRPRASGSAQLTIRNPLVDAFMSRLPSICPPRVALILLWDRVEAAVVWSIAGGPTNERQGDT